MRNVPFIKTDVKKLFHSEILPLCMHKKGSGNIKPEPFYIPLFS